MNAASFWAGREDQARNGDPDYPDVSGGGVPYPPQPVSAREGAATAPGQAAYDALRMSWLANRIGSPSLEWDKLSDEERAEWDEILAAARERPAPDSVPDLLLDKMDQLDRIGDMCRRPADVAGRSSGSGVVNGTNLAAAILRVVEEAPRIPQAAVTAAAAAQPAPGDLREWFVLQGRKPGTDWEDVMSLAAWHDPAVRAAALAIFRDDEEHAPGEEHRMVRRTESALDGEQPAPAAAPGEEALREEIARLQDIINERELAAPCTLPAEGFQHPPDIPDLSVIRASVAGETAPELAAAMAETRGYRERVTALIGELRTTAAATHPSRKSEIEYALIRKLQAVLDGKP